MANEELQSLINDLRGKLPSDTTIELADFDELPEQADEPQREPWIIGSLDDLEAMVSQVAEAITQAVESGEELGGAKVHRIRRPSPTRRAKAAKRIAAGKDVLRRKPTKESAERWFQRMLYEAFGDADGPEIAQVLGLPPLRRKRGQQ